MAYFHLLRLQARRWRPGARLECPVWRLPKGLRWIWLRWLRLLHCLHKGCGLEQLRLRLPRKLRLRACRCVSLRWRLRLPKGLRWIW